MINQFPAGEMWDEYDKAMTKIDELETSLEAAEAKVAELEAKLEKVYSESLMDDTGGIAFYGSPIMRRRRRKNDAHA